ncbi:5522_t:CDS:2, partial [Entrophospora sp. SA101]
KSSSANIKEILDKYVNNDKKFCKTHSNSANDIKDISTYLKFVDHEKAIVKLMKNMDNLHELMTNQKEYAEPLKHLYFAAIGTAVVRPEITVAERNGIDAGRSFHKSCDSFTTDNLEVVFGLRSLYEILNEAGLEYLFIERLPYITDKHIDVIMKHQGNTLKTLKILASEINISDDVMERAKKNIGAVKIRTNDTLLYEDFDILSNRVDDVDVSDELFNKGADGGDGLSLFNSFRNF